MRVEKISNDSDTGENSPPKQLREICQVLGHSFKNKATLTRRLKQISLHLQIILHIK